MTPSACLQSVLDLLEAVRKAPRPADALASQYFRTRRYIGSKDRAAVASLFYDIIRHHARLGWWLYKTSADDALRTRVFVYLTLVDKQSMDQIAELFSGKKFAPEILSENEITFLKKLKGHTIEHPNMPDSVRVECPDWAAESLKQRFGEGFVGEMQAMLEPAPLDIRVNTLKTTRDAVLGELKNANVEANACHFSPWGVRLSNRPALTSLPMLKDGRIEIQDEGSQLVALIVDPKPGQRVMDFCAGAGGKTLALAAQMNNKGRITASDVMERRLKQSTERFRRAGAHNIETRAFKNEQDPWIKRHKATFDRVLVDAPCSGVGTWRRNPDSRWHSLGPSLEKLMVVQADILEGASRLVKPGGRLIYATCSLLREENEGQIERFLEVNKVFRLVPCSEVLSSIERGNDLDFGSLCLINSYFFMTPMQHKTDGFFGAVLERLI